MAKTVMYKTEHDTQGFGISRMRIDTLERLKRIAVARAVTLNELVNTLLEQGVKMIEGIERKRLEREGMREEVRKVVEEQAMRRRAKNAPEDFAFLGEELNGKGEGVKNGIE